MANLTPQQADTLLQHLESDPAFYDLFKKDPAAALEKIGLPDSFALCCSKITRLPSQDVIRSTRTALSANLTSSLDQNVIGLNAT